MYYKDVGLFGSQSTVDRVRLRGFTTFCRENSCLHFSKLVDDLAATLQLSRSDLSVVCPRALPHTLLPLTKAATAGIRQGTHVRLRAQDTPSQRRDCGAK